jgi:hypothetical protein
MTTSDDRNDQRDSYKIDFSRSGAERRETRRHDMDRQGISVSRWDGSKRTPMEFGRLIDLSPGGVRIRTNQTNVKPDGQIRVRLELPAYAGISPFIDASDETLKPKREWVGWMSVARVRSAGNGEMEVAGRLIDMDETDRGMLGLYLSTQPLAA